MRADRGNVVVGVFRDREQARDAIGALRDMGISGDAISLLTPNPDETRALAADTGTNAGEGAVTGAVLGGVFGGVWGWLAGFSALFIPGVGPFVAAGALATALTGAVLGAGIGAIAGALIGLGIPKEQAEWYEQEVRSGRTLVAVQADGRYDEVRDTLRRYGAYDVESREPAGVGAASTAARWEDAAPRYRSDWEQRYSTTGRWEDYEPSYRYGWEMARDPRYQGRSWAEVEPELRRDWETRHPGTPWDRAGTAMRETWDRDTGR